MSGFDLVLLHSPFIKGLYEVLKKAPLQAQSAFCLRILNRLRPGYELWLSSLQTTPDNLVAFVTQGVTYLDSIARGKVTSANNGTEISKGLYCESIVLDLDTPSSVERKAQEFVWALDFALKAILEESPEYAARVVDVERSAHLEKISGTHDENISIEQLRLHPSIKALEQQQIEDLQTCIQGKKKPGKGNRSR